MTVLTGWGRTSPSRARALAPASPGQIAQLAATAPSAIARGLGRSYGDASQNAGGTVVESRNLTGMDEPGPVMDLEAGVSIDLIAIIQALVIVFMAAPTLVRATIPWVFQKQTGR